MTKWQRTTLGDMIFTTLRRALGFNLNMPSVSRHYMNGLVHVKWWFVNVPAEIVLTYAPIMSFHNPNAIQSTLSLLSIRGHSDNITYARHFGRKLFSIWVNFQKLFFFLYKQTHKNK